MKNYLDYEINKELGECYLFMADYDKAQEYYEKARDFADDQAAPFMGLATIAVQKGDLELAHILYQDALKRECNDKTCTGLGLVSMSLEKHEEAFDLFTQAIEINPSNAVALGCLVQEAYLLNKVAEIISHLENSYAQTNDANIRITLAGCLISIGQSQDAKLYLEEILNIMPDNPSAKDLYAVVA